MAHGFAMNPPPPLVVLNLEVSGTANPKKSMSLPLQGHVRPPHPSSPLWRPRDARGPCRFNDVEVTSNGLQRIVFECSRRGMGVVGVRCAFLRWMRRSCARRAEAGPVGGCCALGTADCDDDGAVQQGLAGVWERGRSPGTWQSARQRVSAARRTLSVFDGKI